MKVICFNRFPIFACNSYLVIENNHGLIIDPGYFSNEMKKEVEKLEGIDGVLITHQHFDHIRGLNDLIQKYPSLNIYANINYGNYINNSKSNLSYYMTPEMKVNYNINPINVIEGQMRIGNFIIDVLFTPGHSNDGACYKIGNNLFLGDTLFLDSVGRYDFPNSSYQDLLISISKIKNLILKENINCYFGHGDNCNSIELLRYNPYLK